MAYRINFTASNKSDFPVDFSAVDVDTGDDIDMTGAEVSVKVMGDDCHWVVVDASIVNGLITQPSSTVLSLLIPKSTMESIRPGDYLIGCVFSLDAGVTVTQLFVGNLTVFEGVAAL